jgi:hypothetical protein
VEYSREYIIQEYAKCFRDKTRIYMIENYFKIQNADVGAITPFKLMPRQKEWLVNCSEHQGNLTLKCRQSGFSTTSCAKIACELVLSSVENPINVLIIAHNFVKAQENTKLVKDFLMQLPFWFYDFKLDPQTAQEKRKIWKTILPQNTKTFVELMNGSKLYSRSSSPTASNGIPAVSILFCDEAALFAEGAACFAEAVRTTSTVRDKCIMMVSTPSGRDPLYYEYYQNAQLGLNGYKITESRWYDDTRYNKHLKFWKDETIEDSDGTERLERKWIVVETIDEKGNVLWRPEEWKKLEGEGWHATSPWYVNACNENNNDRRKIAQSIECSFIGSDTIAIDPKIIDMHRNLNVQTEFKTDPIQPNTWIWKPVIPEHRYILSVDGSRSDGDDSASIEVVDIDAIDEYGDSCVEQVLEFVGKVPMDLVGEWAFKYGKLYNNALIVCDAIGGYSDAAILTLMRMGYDNIYYDNNSTDYLSIDMKLSGTDITNRMPGFRSRGARTYMVENFINKLRENFLKVRSTRVISECETWVVKENGKIEHKKGKHDDTLTNLAMALFVFENNYTKIEKQKTLDNQILGAFYSTLQMGSSKEIAPNPNDIRIKHTYQPLLYTTKTIETKVDNNPYGWLINRK